MVIIYPGIFIWNSQEIAIFDSLQKNYIDDSAIQDYTKIQTGFCNIQQVCGVKISYKKLWILLIEKEISPATLRKDLNIATGTMTKLRKNEEVALSVLLRICEYLDCNIGDICDAVQNDSDSSL